jgi:DNA-binding response OmpR family regulator
MTNQVPKGSIMVVDDQPANLKLMEDMLRQQDYLVRSFPRGRLALAAALQQRPDLILLDINMPEMNGFEVCRRLKANENLNSIPVIFLSALNETEDKLNAFRCGGLDYITKPFQIEEVQARVETQLQVQRARQVERDLLEKTLIGAIKSLVDLLQLCGPAVSQRSHAIKDIVMHVVARLGLEDRWQYELAATVRLIGTMALPAEAFERAYCGDPVSGVEEQMFRAHSAVGSRLLSNIPRLEGVAEMIAKQQMDGEASPANPIEIGARLLRVAMGLDRLTFRGVPFSAALTQLRKNPSRYPAQLLDALEDYEAPSVAYNTKRLTAQELKTSMILDEPLLTQDGSFIIVGTGTTLNATIIERIGNFAKTRGVRQPIRVRVPASSAITNGCERETRGARQ